MKRRRIIRLISTLLVVCLLIGNISNLAFATGSANEETEQTAVIGIGDFVRFGSFSERPILWQVVDSGDGKLKLFSSRILLNGQIDADMHDAIKSAGISSILWEGDSNWHTSDLRRYLNSSEKEIVYEDGVPSYGEYPGFLTNFSASELSMIEDTTHRSLVHFNTDPSEVSGGGGEVNVNFFTTLDFSVDTYQLMRYRDTTEKMFLPDMLDLKEAVEKVSSVDADYSLAANYYYDRNGNLVKNRDYGFVTRTAVSRIIDPFIVTYYRGMYYMCLENDSSTHFTFTDAEYSNYIRPMCYIKYDTEQKISGKGTAEDPYVFEFDNSEEEDGTLKLVSQYPLNGKTLDGTRLSLTFNHEIESIQVNEGKFLVRLMSAGEGQTVYELDETKLKDDVEIVGNTITIDIASADLEPCRAYHVVMDEGVIRFKDTDEKIGFPWWDPWKFTYQPTTSIRGFTLGRDNNSFIHTNDDSKWGERAGFVGVTKHVISKEQYIWLCKHANPAELLKLTYNYHQKWEGSSCFGIAASMAMAYTNNISLSQFEYGIKNYYDMPLPYKNTSFLQCIDYFFLAQYCMNNQNAKGGDIPELLRYMIAELFNAPVLFSYDGHTILAVDCDWKSDGYYHVYMYDMNSYLGQDCGRFTLLKVKGDYSDYSLVTPYGKTLSKYDLPFIQISTIGDIVEINPFLSKQSKNRLADVGLQDERNTTLDNVVEITIPMNNGSFAIENSNGEKLICGADGSFDGTMEVLDIAMFCSDEDEESEWRLTVKEADYFRLLESDATVDIGFYTDTGCLILSGTDIGTVDFVPNDSITFKEKVGTDSCNFSAYLSKNMIEDDSVRMVHIAATASGETSININDDQVYLSAATLDNEELEIIQDLDVYPLKDLDTSDNVVVVSTGIPDDEVVPSIPVLPQRPAVTVGKEPVAALPFTDIFTSDWYYDAVQYVYANDLMTGVSSTRFAPNATLTRAMLVQVLYNLEGKPAVAVDGRFTDVASGAWYADAVSWAAAHGIVNGCSKTSFAPDSPVTREQTAAIFQRYAGYKGLDVRTSGSLAQFSDAGAVSAYARDAMSWAVDAGLLSGKGNGRLDPAGTATRGEIAAILMRFCENVLR